MVRAAALLLLASAWLADPALAQSSQPDEGEGAEANSVFVFNRVCYGQVPKLQGIRNMAAQLGWSPLDDKDLTQFSPDEKAEVVLGWDAPIGERAFRVAVTQGAISDALIERPNQAPHPHVNLSPTHRNLCLGQAPPPHSLLSLATRLKSLPHNLSTRTPLDSLILPNQHLFTGITHPKNKELW